MEHIKNNKQFVTRLVVIAMLGMGLGLYFADKQLFQAESKNIQNLTGTYLPIPRRISPFTLIDDLGKPFSQADLEGHWTFMFFGFTNCPHMCPTTMMELNRMYNKLVRDKIPMLPQVLMVSIDPERDTVKRLHAYVKGFHKDFIGARAEQQQIEKLTKELGVVHMKVLSNNNVNNMAYDIDHSGTVMLFNPNGNLTAFFSMPHDALKIARDYETLIKHG